MTGLPECSLLDRSDSDTGGCRRNSESLQAGIDKDVTKTGEDRRIVLCPRAIAVIERQLRLRDQLAGAGLIDHEHLFFTDKRAPIPDVKYSYVRWQRTLRRLGIRYRKPYMARHTSVSWNLMIGRNPLLVAKDHGHRLTTMLSVYAAWAEGAVEADIAAIRDAMNRTDGFTRTTARKLSAMAAPCGRPVARPESPECARGSDFGLAEAGTPPAGPFGSRFVSSSLVRERKLLKVQGNLGGKGGTRIADIIENPDP